MRLTKLILLLSLILPMMCCFATSERYPSTSVTPEPHEKADPNTKCQCDPSSDPCCIPPLGASSNKTEAPNNTNTDVASCKCDPAVDPCCKRMPGTSKDETSHPSAK